MLSVIFFLIFNEVLISRFNSYKLSHISNTQGIQLVIYI
jgi:hypothetical protein